MELTHIINAERVAAKGFTVYSEFPGLRYRFDLPTLQEEHLQRVTHAVSNSSIPDHKLRRQLLESLASYQPSAKVPEAIVSMGGMPLSWVNENIEHGKNLAVSFADRSMGEPIGSVFAAIPDNDPREQFYFLAHFIRAGTPSIIKPSSHEPLLIHDIVTYLESQGLPPGFVNVIYGDTSSVDQSLRIKRLAEDAQVAIVMGEVKLAENQISFFADHSRAVVLDADQAIPHLEYSLRSPLSCMAEHNILVVGLDNYHTILDHVVTLYKGLKGGNPLDPTTTRGITKQEELSHLAAMLQEGDDYDTMKIISPSIDLGNAQPDQLTDGVVIEHYSGHPDIPANPFMTTPLPFYATGVRLVHTHAQVYSDLLMAAEEIPGGKSMSIAVYGQEDPNLLEDLQNVAYDIKINQSSNYTNGEVHQGIHLHEKLTRGT